MAWFFFGLSLGAFLGFMVCACLTMASNYDDVIEASFDKFGEFDWKG